MRPLVLLIGALERGGQELCNHTTHNVRFKKRKPQNRFLRGGVQPGTGQPPGGLCSPGDPLGRTCEHHIRVQRPQFTFGRVEGGALRAGGGMSGPLLQGCCPAYRPSLLVGLHRAQRCHDSCRATRREWWVCRGGDGDDRRRWGRCPVIGSWRKLQEQTAPFQCCCKHDKPIIDALKTHT